MNSIFLQNELKKLATDFRAGIEEAKYNCIFGHSLLANFPKGCCGIASELLGQFLLCNGFNCQVVYGVYYFDSFEDVDCCSCGGHSWLKFGELYIDITADQFINDSYFRDCKEYIEPVYVGETNSFFNSFDIQSVENYVGFVNDDREQEFRYSEFYNNICKEINKL